MTPRCRALSRVIAIVAVCSIAANASAQLLSDLPHPLLGTLTTSCAPLLSASSKLDTAVQRWARLGGQGTVRVIVSPPSGLLVATLKTQLATLGVPLQADLVRINALVVEVNGRALSALACSSGVAGE